MFKKIIKFIKYHNAFTIGLVLVLVFGGTVFASETVRDNVIGERVVEKQGIDNNALLSANLDNFDFAMQIIDVSQNEPKFYVEYSYKTFAAKDDFWQVIDKGGTLKISKQEIRGKDLGLYVQEELGEILDNQLAYLKKVQTTAQEQGASFVQETTQYTALIGLFLDAETRELPGYEPVVKPVEVVIAEPQPEPEPVDVSISENMDISSPEPQPEPEPEPVGIEMYDEDTGAPYCIKIKAGAMVSEAGKCGSGQAISSGAVPEPEPLDISKFPNIEILLITSHPEVQTEIVTATFAFESQEENITFQCKIDNQEFAECASPQNYSNLTREQHVFEVRVIDQEGYFLQTPASFVWEIVELTVEESVPEPEPLDISTSENIEILTPEPEATTTDEIATTTEDIVTTTEPVIELEPESTPEPEPVDISTSSNINISSLEPEPEFLEPVE